MCFSQFYLRGDSAVVRSDGPPPVLGSSEAIEYVMAQAEAAGAAYDPLDIAEVMAAESEYLLAIGAVGDRVEEDAT